MNPQGPYIGDGGPMRKVWDMVRRVAPLGFTVLVEGESGTGKEFVARAIHDAGRRCGGPFVPVNCAALPEQLVESELFGHERGAFTGASDRRIGKFEAARSGTLFLDEVGEMPLAAQAKTLRALQEREIERVGGDRPIKLDIRIVAATNRNLDRAVKEGGFRQDLFYRLNAVVIRMPPLRDRREEILPLAYFFLQRYSAEACKAVRRMSREAEAALLRHDYPGNVRELQNVIQHAVTMAEGSQIGVEDLPESISGVPAPAEYFGRVKTGELRDALQEARVFSVEKGMRPWHETLRTLSMEAVLDFLNSTNGRDFSRRELADHLLRSVQNGRNKYATAGRVLRTLADNGILNHNGCKANKTRFSIGERFLARDG